MKKLMLLILSFVVSSIVNAAIDTSKKDYKSEIEKQYKIKLPSVKNGLYKPVIHNHIPVYVKKEGIYFCDMAGNKVTDTFETVGEEFAGYFPVKSSKGWGYIDTTFVQIIPCQYVDVLKCPLNSTTCVSNATGRWQLITMSGKILADNLTGINARYENYNAWGVQNSNGRGIISCEGNTIVPLSCDSVCNYDGEIAILRNPTKYMGLYNCKEMRMVTDYNYNDCFTKTTNGICCLQQTSGKWGIMNKNGEEYAPFVYDTPSVIRPALIYYINHPEQKASDSMLKKLYRDAHPARNAYKIEDVIPNDVWNY